MILSHPHDKVENGDKGSNGVRIPSEHKVAKANIVICRNMTCRYASKWRLGKALAHMNRKRGKLSTHFLVELNIIHDLESQSKVSQKNMNTQEANDAEIPQHPVKRTLTILSGDLTFKNVRNED